MNVFDILVSDTIRDRETARFHLIAAAASAAACAVADTEANLDADSIIDSARAAIAALLESRLTAAEAHLARLVEAAFGDCSP